MPVRTITMPRSLDEALAGSYGAPNVPERDSAPGSMANSMVSDLSSSKGPQAASSAKATSGGTFASQDKLPKLPIPELESSCKKYLDALKPLQSSREHEETIAAVQDFLRKDGPELQARLKKYATGKTSYIEQFCTSLVSRVHAGGQGFMGFVGCVCIKHRLRLYSRV